MDIKKELIIGTIGSLFIVIFVFINVNRYKIGLSKTSNSNTNNTFNLTNTSLQTESLILTTEGILKHNNNNDCWIIINNSVYEVTNYLSLHPGGARWITPFCGKDATVAFTTKAGRGSHSQQAEKDLAKLKIGELKK